MANLASIHFFPWKVQPISLLLDTFEKEGNKVANPKRKNHLIRVAKPKSDREVRTGTIESNVYQRTGDYPAEWSNGFHVMLDTDELVTVRCNQVESEH